MELVEGAQLEVMMSPGSVSESHRWLAASVLALGGSKQVATAARELLNRESAHPLHALAGPSSQSKRQ